MCKAETIFTLFTCMLLLSLRVNATWVHQETFVTEPGNPPTSDYEESKERVREKKRCNEERPCRLPAYLAGILPKTICEIIDRLNRTYVSKFPNAAILSGPPGTGKTQLVEAIVEHTEAHAIFVSAASIITVYQGSGSLNVRATFDEAEKLTKEGKKVIIFIDEIDAVAKNRDHIRHEELGATLNQLLVEISKHANNPNLFIFVATNKIELLDGAIRSRFLHVAMPLPDVKTCEAIFEFHMRRFPHEQIKQYLPEFARVAHKHKFSGRDIKMLVNQAIYACEAAGAGVLVKEALDDALVQMVEKKKQEEKDLESEQKKLEGTQGSRVGPLLTGVHSVYEVAMIVSVIAQILQMVRGGNVQNVRQGAQGG